MSYIRPSFDGALLNFRLFLIWELFEMKIVPLLPSLSAALDERASAQNVEFW